MATRKPVEFIEHTFVDGVYLTDIWFDPTDNKYRSILTSVYGETFDTLEECHKRIHEMQTREVKKLWQQNENESKK